MTELSPAQLAAEIHHFIRGYQQIRGLDPEFIYRIHAGSELEAELRISRLQQIAEYLKRLQEPEGPTDEELLTNNNHPITPPPELVEQLQDLGNLDAITFAYQAGADMELDGCCAFEENCYGEEYAATLRRHRRPKKPSEAEVALEALSKIDGYAVDQMSAYAVYDELRQGVTTIRQALERLREIEKSNG